MQLGCGRPSLRWQPAGPFRAALREPLPGTATAAARKEGAGVGAGYSAGDAPDRRKNPELYRSLQQESEPPPPPQQQQQRTTGEGASGAAAVSGPKKSSKPATSSSGPALPASSAHAADAASPPPMAARRLVKPEVLAPAGGWPQLKAAVENGADAVYFGVSEFNARARAENFTLEGLHEVMTFLHDRGVRGYLAMNVLIFDEELRRAEECVRAVAAAGVDAAIVQDLGLVKLIRRVAPSLPIHGSTQMTITSAEGAEFAAALGIDRVVVGRELSAREIGKVQQGTSAEVEAFVHGALCVSYSGQCFSSEAWGGRSANRGQCAQACRMPYGLLVDGMLKELGDVSYLLSPQDLMAVEQVPALIAAGVGCFKIEGRLKGPEYVAATTQAYRRAVDAAWAALTEGGEEEGQPEGAAAASVAAPAAAAAAATDGDATTTSSSTRVAVHQYASAAALALPATATVALDPERLRSAEQAVALSPQARRELRQVFARGQDGAHDGLTPGFLEGVKHQRLVRGRAPRHRGLYVGAVTRVTPRGGIYVQLEVPLKRGDGLVFDAGRPESQEEGGSVYNVLDGRGRPLGRAYDDGGGGSGRGAAPAAAATGRRARGGAAAGSGPDADGSPGGGATAGGSTVAAGQEVQLVFGPGQVDPSRVRPGQLVWMTKDHALEAKIRSSYENLSSAELRKVPVRVAVSGAVGRPLTLTLRDAAGNEASGSTAVPLSSARQRPLTAEDVLRAIGELGDNVLTVPDGGVDLSALDLAQGLFLPASELKAARRAAADALIDARRRHPYAESLAAESVVQQLVTEPFTPAATAAATAGGKGWAAAATAPPVPAAAAAAGGKSAPSALPPPRLRLLCRSRAQVDAALRVPWLDELVLDFLEVHGLKEAVASVRAAGRRVVVATPRVLKPDEERLWLFYLRLGADALLLRSAGLLTRLLQLGGPGAAVPDVPHPVPRLEGDFSLNAANAIATRLLLSSGLDRVAPTHDLNASQLAALGRNLGAAAAADHLELILHQHMPIFHTEHCVFCRFLSSGSSYKDCGHPCEGHTVHLRDDKGADHLVLADMGCRNTVFGAQAQSGAHYVQELLASGYRLFRIELVDEPAEQVPGILETYGELLAGRRSAADAWRWLEGLTDANGRRHGVGSGSLEPRKERPVAALKPTAASGRLRN